VVTLRSHNFGASCASTCSLLFLVSKRASCMARVPPVHPLPLDCIPAACRRRVGDGRRYLSRDLRARHAHHAGRDDGVALTCYAPIPKHRARTPYRSISSRSCRLQRLPERANCAALPTRRATCARFRHVATVRASTTVRVRCFHRDICGLHYYGCLPPHYPPDSFLLRTPSTTAYALYLRQLRKRAHTLRVHSAHL